MGYSMAECKHTQGNIGTALGDDARSGISLDSAEVLADTGVVGGVALGVGLDGSVEAGQSASGNISAGLSLGQSGEGKSENGRGLHFDGIKRIGFRGELLRDNVLVFFWFLISNNECGWAVKASEWMEKKKRKGSNEPMRWMEALYVAIDAGADGGRTCTVPVWSR